MLGDADEITDERFEGLDARGAVVEGREFNACVFVGVQLADARFARCRFIDCVFERCDLSNVTLTGCTVRDVRFEDTKLLGVNWTAVTTLSHPSFVRCLLSYGNFRGVDLRKAVVEDCVARETEWAHAKLAGASCRGTDFSGSRFLQTDLSKADFRGASRYAIDPTANVVKKARFALPEAISLLRGLDIVLDD